jgi:DNA-directed RNA polymerase subunit RPC12/RpoP
MPLVHLDCPSCGGALSLAEGERIVACRYCKGRSVVLLPDSVPRHVVEARIDEAGAAELARTILRVAAAAKGIRLHPPTLCYIPFYEATAVRLGTVFVRDRVKPPAPLRSGEQSGPELDRWLQDPGEVREDTRVVEQDVLRIGPACDLQDLGVDRIPLAELRRGGTQVTLQPFDPLTLYGRGVVFTPTLPAERFLQETTWRMPSKNDDTRYVESRLKLLYYPVWQVPYGHGGSMYPLTLDAVTGALLRGTAPRHRAGPAVIASAGFGLAAFGLGRWVRWIAGGGGEGPLVLLAALAGGVLLWLGWRSLDRDDMATLETE